jgi:hypothetical protein
MDRDNVVEQHLHALNHEVRWRVEVDLNELEVLAL